MAVEMTFSFLSKIARSFFILPYVENSFDISHKIDLFQLCQEQYLLFDSIINIYFSK